VRDASFAQESSLFVAFGKINNRRRSFHWRAWRTIFRKHPPIAEFGAGSRGAGRRQVRPRAGREDWRLKVSPLALSSFQEPDMLTRSIESTIHFNQPFRLTPFDRAQPAGSYHLITEEEQLEGLSFAAFQRVRTLLYLPANALPGRAREVIDVDPNELAVALVVDALQSLGGRLAATT
jgi:hypothetical protein